MSKPVRVLQVVPNMQAGGLETLIMNLYRNIDRSKIQFDFLVHYKGKYFYDDEIKKLGGRIYHLSVRDDNNFLKYLNDLDHFFKTHREYKVVHGHMMSTAIFYMYYAKKYGVKIRIIHSHNSDTVPGLKGIVKYRLARLAPMVANNYFACEKTAGKYLYGDNRKFTILNNGIDLQKFKYNSQIRHEYRDNLGLNGKYVIGHIGRFNIQKNHKFLIKVFYDFQKEVPNSVLLLIGDGELKMEIQKEVQDLGLEDKVRFMGVRKDTQNLYQAMDLFLLPSFFEGFPVVAVEAQDAGLPILASSNVTKEIELTPLVRFQDLQESTKEWVKAIKNMPKLLRKDYVTELENARFNIKQEAQQLAKFYEQAYEEK